MRTGLRSKHSPRRGIAGILMAALLAVAGLTGLSARWNAALAQTTCMGPMTPVSPALNDLGQQEYVRLGGSPTGFTGGLYPGGENVRPPAHELAGAAIARQITPLDESGVPDPVGGKIVLVSTGMSNSAQEFAEFMVLAEADPSVNSKLVLVNGASGGLNAANWADPLHPAWDILEQRLADAGVTPSQVQITWNKHALVGSGDFPEKAAELQFFLEEIARNMLPRFPNIKLAYFSSRTRAYVYWNGLSPEPVAMETGFAVKWLVEAQINGDPALNYDPALGTVSAPFLSWAAYLWADGTNARSDGFSWLPEDLVQDCVHPSTSGKSKVADLLLDFFKSDTTATPWFLETTGQHLPIVRRSPASANLAEPGSDTADSFAAPVVFLLVSSGMAVYSRWRGRSSQTRASGRHK